MKIPKHIFHVLNSKHGFDNLFLYKLKDAATPEAAYEMAVDYVREYLPKFKAPYGSYSSYRSKSYLEKNDEVDIPDDVLDAAVSGINDLYYKFLNRYKTNVMAYDATMNYINKHLPNFKPYSSYRSFRWSFLSKRKREIKNKRK